MSFLVVALALAVAFPAMAQDASTARGNLSGLVYDSSQSLVPGAQVTITGPIGSLTQNSNAQGAFLFSTLVPGYYTVKATKNGFKTSEAGNVEVLINKTTSVQMTLEPGTVTQTVEISSTSLTVDTSGTAVNSNLADTFYQNIPVQRNVASLFYLAPGVVSGGRTGNSNPSISGGSGLENLYVADGVSITQSAYGGLGVWSTAYGALGSGINLSFVKEVQVKTAAFEPQYGQSTGGIIQIVTKSGGTQFHGSLNGYFNTTGMQTEFANADDPQFHVNNLVGRHLNTSSYEGDAEFGGYVPFLGLKDKLFFFGTFNPSWTYDHWAPAVTSGLFVLENGNNERRTFAPDWAGKLTYKINNSNTIEASAFADPNSTNNASFSTLNSDNASANSHWNYGTRNLAVRYDGAVSPTWQVDAAFTYNWNHFTETPATDIYQIVDLTQTGAGFQNARGQFNAQGIGFVENYQATGKGFNFNTSKVYSFGGQHTFMIGYLYNRPNYNDITTRSGPRFDIPVTNADGVHYLSAENEALVAGQSTNAAFSLRRDATGTCTLCPLMSVPTSKDGSTPPVEVPVFLQTTRGTFSSGVSMNSGVYHTAYVNDSWAMGSHVTLNLGLRWEQQRVNGNVAGANFKNMWSPRIGFIVDPKGDRKSKIYASFARLAFVLPLDMAIRSLSSEADYLGTRFAPQSDGPGGACDGVNPCHIVLNAFNTANVIPDAAHVLDGAVGGQPIRTTVSAQSGAEPFVPSTRMEYNDEFVVGAEHEFRGGIFASARYIDRRLKRIIEDFSGISIEAAEAGLSQTYVIGNPTGATDFVVNPNEITFGIGAPFTGPLPAACFDTNGNQAPTVIDNTNTFGQVLGSACFPSVNMNPWTDSAGNVLPGAQFGGEVGADGKPDGFVNPKREYQAVEFEVNKSFSHNWNLLANWRIARLWGNYEGAFRNDSGQADPGISSLYDFTPGEFGLIGFQQSPGILNTDRKHVVNVYSTYVLDRSFMKGLVLGGGLKLASGVPLTTIAAQEAYVNSGEVPLFGRGDLGRAPVTGTIDTHLEYPWKINDRFTLKLGFDAFNIGNTKRETLINQNVDLQFGVPNSDFKNAYRRFFVTPFQSRGIIRLEF
ncbi:MAG: TonB-dependent receptor [Candidatus Acidiferrales bacterium]